MNLLKLLERLYECLWRPTAGRPWTYEIRDWSDRHPAWAWTIGLSVAAGFIAGQVLLPMFFGWAALPFVLFADFAAYLGGHLYWDTIGPYIPAKTKFRD